MLVFGCFILSLGKRALAQSVAEPVGCRASRRVSFVFSDALNPGYVFVNIGVDADVPAHEVSNLDPLELVFADDSSNGHFLPESVQREGEGERDLVRSQRCTLVPSLGEPCLEVAGWVLKRVLKGETGALSHLSGFAAIILV